MSFVPTRGEDRIGATHFKIGPALEGMTDADDPELAPLLGDEPDLVVVERPQRPAQHRTSSPCVVAAERAERAAVISGVAPDLEPALGFRVPRLAARARRGAVICYWQVIVRVFATAGIPSR